MTTETPTSGFMASRMRDTPEARYYSAYEWSLNPVLTVRELCHRLSEALAGFEALPAGSWQREECKANLGLYVGAITCTVDDYLGEPAPSFSRLVQRFPALRGPLFLAQKFLDISHYVLNFPAKFLVSRWRRTWIRSADAIWELLAGPGEPTADEFRALRVLVERHLALHLPRRLLDRPMQLPSGYRSQDLTHHDAFLLADLFSASQPNQNGRLLVLGPRSMGAYFAPAVKARLSTLGWTSVSWCTLRPKHGISPWEQRWLRSLASSDVRVLVADESPNTGNTFLLLVRMLRALGVEPERIFLLAAMHPTRPDWCLPPDSAECRGVTLLRLEANRLHKDRLLQSAGVQPLLEEYFRAVGYGDVEVTQSRETQALNTRLDAHFKDGFQCRLKRVFDVRLRRSGDDEGVARRILAKSVGWGWLGYHAYFAGQRLAEFVPETYGLRNGLLFTAWVEEPEEGPQRASNRPSVDRMALYVSARVRELRLQKDPILEAGLDYGWSGWRMLNDICRNAFGPFVGRVKMSSLHRQLARFACPVPALTDGRMSAEDWIQSPSGFQKVDFEHHNFGRTELYIVDSAYDLATATFEFQLSPREEQELLAKYALASGDVTVGERILLWKLLRGTVVVYLASIAIAHEERGERLQDWHRRLWDARNDLVYQMNRFSASLVPDPHSASWTRRLFFMDLDGVFDTDVLGFPQTTTSGLVALSLLQAHGFSVILNTARGVKDVQQYCQAYRLPGGLAELGCIFVDAVHGREIPLVDPESAEQLASCREALQSLRGVFVDPTYRAAIRTYRNVGRSAVPIEETELRSLIGAPQFNRLTFSSSSADTMILPKGIGKGPGMTWVKQYLDLPGDPVVAIGDNDHDVEMLRNAEIAYAPANSSGVVRQLAAAGQCRMTRSPSQRGLLEASRQVIHGDGRMCDKCQVVLARADGSGALLQTLMEVAERSRVQQYLSLLKPWAL